MIIKFEIKSKEYQIDTLAAADISIPLIFNGDQPNIYEVDKASAKAFEWEQFIGDTRRGGSCNFEEYKLITHCNGTHTECVGHISYERISVHNTLKNAFVPSTLITVNSEKAFDTDEGYIPAKEEEDRLITKKCLQDSLGAYNKNFLEGLIIRTLPNDDSKKSRRYMKAPPPFFSIEAMEYITELSVEHLLVDIPSVDRAFDEGKLTAHHIFWSVPKGSHEVDIEKHSMKTITEMIYVPNEVKDGLYLLNLQIAPFAADASPSKPVIFKIIN